MAFTTSWHTPERRIRMGPRLILLVSAIDRKSSPDYINSNLILNFVPGFLYELMVINISTSTYITDTSFRNVKYSNQTF